MAKSVDNMLVKIDQVSDNVKNDFKTLGIGIICNISDLCYVIGNPDKLLIDENKIVFIKGKYEVIAYELDNY